LNIHKVNDVRQIEIHTAELLVPKPTPFEVEIAIGKLKNYKSPGNDHILPELIQTGGETLWYDKKVFIHRQLNQYFTRIFILLLHVSVS
jgi:hypothetical protein